MAMTMMKLAENLGLSVATVSRVLNGCDKKRVRPELAARIREEARKAGFQPDRAAGQLRRRRSNLIGILLPSLSIVNFYSELAGELHELILKRGYFPVFAFWIQMEEAVKAYRNIVSWRIDGLITVQPDIIEGKPEFPVVSYYNEDPRFDCLVTDSEQIFRELLEYLTSLGHRNIVWIGCNFDGRLPCLMRLCPEYSVKIKYMDCDNSIGLLSSSAGYCLTEKMLKEFSADLPTAIVASSDDIAFGAIRCLADHGYHCPEDFSVIGSDDVKQAELYIPALTTIKHSDKTSLAELLTDQIFKKIEKPDLPRDRVVIKRSLAVRDSCAPPRSHELTSIPRRQ